MEITTFKKYGELLETEAMYRVNGLSFGVVIKDFKVSYGKTRFLIQPVKGEGQIWVNEDSLNYVGQ